MTRRKAFTLIELMIVVAIIAIIAAIAIPGLLRARINSNEVSAQATLKSLASAQEVFKTQKSVDTNGDGVGEYGFFQELAGTSNTRTNAGKGGAKVSPSNMSSHFGKTAESTGYARKSGYHFRVWLPRDDTTASAESESATLQNGNTSYADAQSTRWACYAWPASKGNTGNKVFAINQDAQAYEAQNNATTSYTSTTGPGANAAFDTSGTTPANLDAPLATTGATAGDGQSWVPSG